MAKRMITEQQKTERAGIIGGSDIAAVMGLSRWKTPLALWAEKTGKIENELSNFEAAEIGTELEEYVSNKFQRKTGIKLRRDHRTFRHPVYGYMVCHIDRWVIGEDAVFEAKTASAWKVKEWEGEQIPQEYVLQVIWELGLLKKKKGYIAVLIGGQKFVWKEIYFDLELFDKMVSEAKRFMEEFILQDVPPMALADDQETVAHLFPTPSDQVIRFHGETEKEIDQLVVDRTAFIQAKKNLDEKLDGTEARIKQLIGEAQAGETEQHRITWKQIQKKEFVVKAQTYRQLRTTKLQ